MDGLLYGCGDAVIGINPATDSMDSMEALRLGLSGVALKDQRRRLDSPSSGPGLSGR